MNQLQNTHVCRHIETDKNLRGLHGVSANCKSTKWTLTQAKYLSDYFMDKSLTKIVYGNTPQCLLTADLVNQYVNTRLVKLNLTPFDLKEYSGLTHKDLLYRNSELATAMELFRYRILPYHKTQLVEFCNPRVLKNSIITWSKSLPTTLNNSLLVLSSSLIVKVVNYFLGILPDSSHYKNIGVANAGVINMLNWSADHTQWPDSIHHYIDTKFGKITAIEYCPKISPYSQITVIIYPGIFGSSRFGPYNLFNRMARDLAEKGFKSIVFDPLGSGENIPIYRSLSTEIESLNSVINHFASDNLDIVLIAHSLSANIAAHNVNYKCKRKYLVAPILDIKSRYEAWTKIGNSLFRHGLIFSDDLLANLDIQYLNAFTDIECFFGTNDLYVDYQAHWHRYPRDHTYIIEGAGHNFSQNNLANELIRLISSRITEFHWS